MNVSIEIVDGFAHDVSAFSDNTGLQRVCRGTSAKCGRMRLEQTICSATILGIPARSHDDFREIAYTTLGKTCVNRWRTSKLRVQAYAEGFL